MKKMCNPGVDVEDANNTAFSTKKTEHVSRATAKRNGEIGVRRRAFKGTKKGIRIKNPYHKQ